MSAKLAYLQLKFAQDVCHDESSDESPKDFFDRDAVKRKALDILFSPAIQKAVVIIGERRAGKTSKLRLLLNKCRSEEGFVVFEVPWQIIQSAADFYRAFLHEMEKILRSGATPLISDAEVRDASAFWYAYQARKKELADKTVVVGIDEFDSILKQCAEADDEEWKKVYSTVYRLSDEPGVKVIVAMVRHPNTVEPLRGSPFALRSEPIELRPFKETDFVEFVRSYFESLSDTEIQELSRLSGNWPYYAKAVLHHLLQIDERNDRRLQMARIEAVNSIEQTCKHLYAHHWSKDERQALLLLSSKDLSPEEDLARLSLPLRTAFRRLVERGYLTEEARKYRFRVGLIEDWFGSWIDRELEEHNLGIPDLLRQMRGGPDPWDQEPGEISIRITKEELRRRGF